MSPVFLRHVRRDNLSLSLFLLFTSARPSVPALPAGRLLFTRQRNKSWQKATQDRIYLPVFQLIFYFQTFVFVPRRPCKVLWDGGSVSASALWCELLSTQPPTHTRRAQMSSLLPDFIIWKWTPPLTKPCHFKLQRTSLSLCWRFLYNAKPLQSGKKKYIQFDHWWDFFYSFSLAASVALKAFTGHRGDVSGGNRMVITSLDIATFTLWLTSASGVFYWGVLECVCAGDWARGVDLMEPKGWLHWKGRICLQFTQLTQQRKIDGDAGWVMQAQK